MFIIFLARLDKAEINLIDTDINRALQKEKAWNNAILNTSVFY
ncbi:hypothetical protein DSUL_50057 [Desulfovibrionales bacterium]